jgi:hypothetical protein
MLLASAIDAVAYGRPTLVETPGLTVNQLALEEGDDEHFGTLIMGRQKQLLGNCHRCHSFEVLCHLARRMQHE